MATLTYLKVFFPAFIAFCFGIGMAPIVTTYLYKWKMWKKKPREVDNVDAMSAEFERIHDAAAEKKTPRVGGVLIWFSVIATALFFWILHIVAPSDIADKFEFISRSQTWILFLAMLVGALIGLMNELLQIYPDTFWDPHGFSRKQFFLIMLAIGVVGGLWFYFKLDVTSIIVPFVGAVAIGLWIIPLFVVVMLGLFASGVIDGIDGLSGGVFAIMYAAFGVIALFQNQIDIATFCFVTASGILAFLWFNVPPARFYMGETGMLALTVPLAFIGFMTGRVLWILIIGFPLVATALSSFIQIYSKKYFKRKVFRVAPLHHHFQAMGWPNEKVVMRYWIFTMMVSVLGIVLAVIS